jgi:hypothetical protein
MGINITTATNGFVYNDELFLFTNEQLNPSTQGYNSYWLLSPTQVGIEGNNQVIFFDITINTINNNSYASTSDFVTAIGL